MIALSSAYSRCNRANRDLYDRRTRRVLDQSDGAEPVIRNVEIIGEAVKALSEKLRSDNPDIPWKQIAGMRDVLIHHYSGVKLETVWRVAVEHLQPLSAKVRALLAD